jgi:sulfite reductase beta subunit-like hemoprotein
MAINQENGAASALTNLEDDMVKLVAYTIVCLRRHKERIMEGGQDSVIVTDRMTGETFTAMIIAQYFQEQVADPDDKTGEKKISRIEWLKKQQEKERWEPSDQKYLRVYYVVSNRWPREPEDFEEKQIERLREIKNSL